MSSVKVKVEGTEKLLEALRKEPEAVHSLLKEAVLDGAQVVQGEIELKAPRLTGALAGEGFTTKAGFETRNSLNAIVTITERLFVYAFYNEFGVKKHRQPAKPFIRPAFDAKRAAAAGIIERRLRERYGGD